MTFTFHWVKVGPTRLSRKRHILGPSPIKQKQTKCDLLAV